ncbi:MAG: ABC-F family ATP-binding cassette domain-containing protein [Candidatus Sericytochromatia bacterium]|nr:ABC-F family ATP-binding cassette domain-containing protein [Candidatus Tanganyikabacteria bacterium]
MPPAGPALLSCHDLGKQFGSGPLFAGLTFGLHDGDRVGVVGPNGAGKSTFIKILAGLEEPDAGAVALRKFARIGYVPQDPEFPAGATVAEVLTEALSAEALEDYEKLGIVAETLGRCGFEDGTQRVSTLSGGWRKRLAVGRARVTKPDVLLLDEPTNHLDVDGILWLEALLGSDPRAFIAVSHDRWFLEHVAGRILEIDRRYPGGLFEVRGTYSQFLAEREAALASQAAHQDALANRVRREIEWLRRGPQGRQTKQQARGDEAGRLIDDLADLKARSAQRTAQIAFSDTERRTRKLIDATGIAKAYADRPVFENLDVRLGPGTRLGLLGPNGSGKTTLLKILEGATPPDAGTIFRADGLRTVHFAQDRGSLDPALPLRKALAADGEQVVYQDRALHVAAWAKRFLFPAEHLDLPVGRLSGGEQARLLIARLMLQPADLLILDEPTNDLDIPTLAVLEEALLEFKGALVLVTHDRFLLDRVSTLVLALDDDRATPRYFADYQQWLAARQLAPAKPRTKPPAAPRPRKPAAGRLSYREQQEWDGMESRILEAETHLGTCQQAVEDPAVASAAGELQRRCEALEAARTSVARLYDRWAELEAKQGES